MEDELQAAVRALAYAAEEYAHKALLADVPSDMRAAADRLARVHARLTSSLSVLQAELNSQAFGR